MPKATCDQCGKPRDADKEHFTILNLRSVPKESANKIKAAAALANETMTGYVVEAAIMRVEAEESLPVP